MHFRERGTSVQLVRTSYDATTKKPKQEIVGRIPLGKLQLDGQTAAKLTPQEAGEVQRYIEQAHSVEQLRSKLAAHSLSQTIAQATAYARGITDEAERDLLRAHFAEAIVALRRAAHPNPQQKPD